MYVRTTSFFSFFDLALNFMTEREGMVGGGRQVLHRDTGYTGLRDVNSLFIASGSEPLAIPEKRYKNGR